MNKIKFTLNNFNKLNSFDKNLAVYLIAFLENMKLVKIKERNVR